MNENIVIPSDLIKMERDIHAQRMVIDKQLDVLRRVTCYYYRSGNNELTPVQIRFVRNVLPHMITHDMPNIDKVFEVYGLSPDMPLTVYGNLPVNWGTLRLKETLKNTEG